MEVGVKCAECSMRFYEEGDLNECDDCGAFNVCPECLIRGACCATRLEELEEDAAAAEREADALRDAVSRKQSAA